MPFLTNIVSGDNNLVIFNKAQYNQNFSNFSNLELVTKQYVDDAVAGGGSGSGFPLSQDESANNFSIINLRDPTGAQDAVNLRYLTTQLSSINLSNYYNINTTNSLLSLKADITQLNDYVKLSSGTTQNITSDLNVNGTLQTSRLYATAGGSQTVSQLHSQSGTGGALEVHKVGGSGIALDVINDGSNIAVEINHNTVSNTNPALKIINASSSASIDAGSGKIINVANGTTSNDAINKSQLDLKADINNPTFTGTVSGITKTMVGLGNVDDTSDLSKPVSTATQTALDLKAPIANPTFTGTVGGITKAMVGLGNVDNTSDLSKAISTATQSALDLKANLSGATFTGNITVPVATAGGHALNRDTADVRYVNASGDSMSNTLTMAGGNIVISSGVLQQQWTSSGSNQFERPLSLGANASIQQNTSAPTNTIGPSTITSLTVNNQTELATGGASQTAIGGTIATATDREDSAQHIKRLNSTASSTGANSNIVHYRRHTTHDANWKLMKSLTDGSAAKGTNFGYALTANQHENIRLKWFPSSTVASDQDLITFTRNNITFNQPPSYGTNPSSSSHLANKSYVDSVAGNSVKTNLNNQQIVPTTPSTNNTLQVEANGANGSAVIAYTSNVSNAGSCLRVVNLGTGDCFRVEDSSGDSSLVRIDNNGRMGVNVGTASLIQSFEAISQGNSTSFRVNNDIELSTVADLYLGAGGQALNRPNCRITFSGNADSNFQRFYFQLGNVTAGGNGKFTFTKASSNEATLNICPEIKTVALGPIDSGTTSTNAHLGIWSTTTMSSISLAGDLKNSTTPAIDINSRGRIANCLDPVNNQDVATKKYVDDNALVRRYCRWSNQGVAFSWASGSNAMYYSSDGTSTLIADTDNTNIPTANNRGVNKGSLSTYIEFVSITNAFQQATVHCWRALIAGEYSFKFKARMNDGASNYYSQMIYRDVTNGSNIRLDECWFSTDEGQRRFQFYESRIYMKVNDYVNFEFGNISGGVVRPITMNAHAYIEVTVEYLGA